MFNRHKSTATKGTIVVLGFIVLKVILAHFGIEIPLPALPGEHPFN